MTKSKGRTDEPRTGKEFIALAEKRGAKVSHDNSGFTKVKTPQGSVKIFAGNEKLDGQTVSNLKKWFKLLGLMLFLFLCLYPILIRVM